MLSVGLNCLEIVLFKMSLLKLVVLLSHGSSLALEVRRSSLQASKSHCILEVSLLITAVLGKEYLHILSPHFFDLKSRMIIGHCWLCRAAASISISGMLASS